MSNFDLVYTTHQKLAASVQYEREQCALVCEALALKNEQAAEQVAADADDAASLRSAAWKLRECAAEIRKRGQ